MRRPSRPSRLLLVACLVTLLVPALLVAPERADAALAPGFQDDLITGIGAPTALAFTPDGRMLITTQPGKLHVYQNGALVGTPAIDLAATRPFCANFERGLLGVAVDPAFADNSFIYLYYTVKTGAGCGGVAAANRVSRFTLSAGNVAADEQILIDNIPNPAGNHNGGDLNFGKDGHLYVSVGDGGSTPGSARQLNILSGKILRITAAGGIPADNPYQGAGTARCNTTGGAPAGTTCQEVYASGLRNPFRFAFDPNAAGTRFFINDVGQGAREEIDLGQAGADYGWDLREGLCAYPNTGSCGPQPAGLTNPIYDYARFGSPACSSITGGAFVPDGVWPTPDYDRAYLFSDYVCGRIFLLAETSPGTWTRTDFATDLGGSSAVHLRFGPFGATQALYYTTYADGGQIRRIAYTGDANRAPTAAIDASPRTGQAPLLVDFSGALSADPDSGDTLTWEWAFGDGATATTDGPTTSHSYAADGTYTATLRVRDNHGALSSPATVRIVVGNAPPVPTILTPPPGTAYQPGQSYTLTGGATDDQEGAIPAERLSWQVILHHNTHTHPILGPVTGNNITLVGPSHDEGENWLEIRLTATDALGASATVVRALRLGGASFTDVPPGHPAYEAVSELAAQGIIQGYGDGRFGPDDTSLRAQMAALIVRAMGWSGETHANPFPDQGVVDDELWAAVATLAAREVALGYEDGTYNPTGEVLQIQVISFISRAMVERGLWAAATADDPMIYPNVQIALRDRLDLVTYVRNAGALPDRPADQSWVDWNAPAPRGWFARVLWQALNGE